MEKQPMLKTVQCVLLLALIAARSLGQAVPTQLRLSYGEDPKTTIRVVWQTPQAEGEPAVEYGPTDALGSLATGKRVTYPLATGTIYEVTLTGLKPGAKYHYRAGHAGGAFSPTYTFQTAVADPDEFFFTAFGDHGAKPATSGRNVQNIIKEAPAFHLLLGDISYANGDQPVWDTYLQMLEPLARQIPFMPTLGNHEYESKVAPDGEKLGYRSYLARFALPGNEDHYTFDYGNARFVAINSDSLQRFNDEAQKQLAWLRETLAKARKDPKVRWLIVFQHHPLYGSTKNRGNNTKLIQMLEPIFDEFKVDLVLEGHDHVYERKYPLRAGSPVSTNKQSYRQSAGTIYVIQGGGGQSIYELVPEQPATTAIREAVNGYLRVRVPKDGPLTVEARRLDGTLIEQFQIQPTRTAGQP
jgi:acid phosphatase type 7